MLRKGGGNMASTTPDMEVFERQADHVAISTQELHDDNILLSQNNHALPLFFVNHRVIATDAWRACTVLGMTPESYVMVRMDDGTIRTLSTSLVQPIPVRPPGCSVCHKLTDKARIMVCNGCDLELHMKCHKPALKSIPSSWLCDSCVTEQQRTISTKKRLRTASATSTSTTNPSTIDDEFAHARIRVESQGFLYPAVIIQSHHSSNLFDVEWVYNAFPMLRDEHRIEHNVPRSRIFTNRMFPFPQGQVTYEFQRSLMAIRASSSSTPAPATDCNRGEWYAAKIVTIDNKAQTCSLRIEGTRSTIEDVTFNSLALALEDKAYCEAQAKPVAGTHLFHRVAELHSSSSTATTTTTGNSVPQQHMVPKEAALASVVMATDTKPISTRTKISPLKYYGVTKDDLTGTYTMRAITRTWAVVEVVGYRFAYMAAVKYDEIIRGEDLGPDEPTNFKALSVLEALDLHTLVNEFGEEPNNANYSRFAHFFAH